MSTLSYLVRNLLRARGYANMYGIDLIYNAVTSIPRYRYVEAARFVSYVTRYYPSYYGDYARFLSDKFGYGTGSTGSTSTTGTNTGDNTGTTSTTGTASQYGENVTVNGTTMVVTGNQNSNIFLGGRDPFNGLANDYKNDTVTTLNAAAMTSSVFLGGNSLDDSIIAGSGGNSIWGGSGGNDTMVGGSGKDNFFYASGGGNDSVVNFTAGTSSTSDVVTLYKGAGLKEIERDGAEIVFETRSGGKLTVNTSSEDVNTAIQYSRRGYDVKNIKIGNTGSVNTLTYDKNISYYYGGEKTDTLKIDETSGKVSVNLAKSAYKDIEVIDASGSTSKNILQGDREENTIIGGSGTNTLWGGGGDANDTLIGGTGETNYFYYGRNQGDDKITGAKSGDYIRLYNVRGFEIGEYSAVDGVGIKMNIAGGSLSVDKIDGVKFVMSGGSTYSYDAATNTFAKQTNGFDTFGDTP